jgi:tetratricopeptide (TPR) repeat protein
MDKQDYNEETQAAQSSGGMLAAKTVIGFTILTVIWFAGLRNTSLDPILQVSATISHLASSEKEITLEELAVKVTEEDDRTVYNNAVIKLKQGSYYGSARDLTRLGAKYSSLNYPLGKYYLKRGEELYNEGKYRQASECLKISVDYFVRQSGKAHLLLAKTCEELGEKEEAAKHHKLAETYETNKPNISFDPINTVLSLIITLILSLVIAVILSKVFSPAPEVNPVKARPSDPQPEAWTTPDTTDGSIGEAEQQYGSITKILTAEDRLQQAMLLLEEDMFDDAFEIFRQAAALNPGVSTTISQMCLEHGIVLYDQQKLQRAAKLFEIALQHTPHDLHCHTYLANCCIKLNLFEKAVGHYLNVVRINPDHATGYYNLGICYHKTGNTEHAIRSFEVAADKENLPNAHFYLAKLNEATGNSSKAIIHWKKCAELAPDTPQGKRAIERLSQLH